MHFSLPDLHIFFLVLPLPWQAGSQSTTSGSLTGLLSRLEAAFFQQHPHLHRCTELALQVRPSMRC